jgi:hypothetical protein
MTTQSPKRSEDISDLAERRFARVLEQRCYSYWPETSLAEKIAVRGKNPDFYVEADTQGTFLAEVKSFKETRLTPLVPGQLAISDPSIYLAAIRSAFKEAAKQLKPYQDYATLVVLDNWRLVGIPSAIEHLRDALFGTPEYGIGFRICDGTTEMKPWESHLGGGQTLTPQEKCYISAVAWNMPKIAFSCSDPHEDSPMRLRIVHNPFASTPLPLSIFQDEEDEHWSLDEGALRKS